MMLMRSFFFSTHVVCFLLRYPPRNVSNGGTCQKIVMSRRPIGLLWINLLLTVHRKVLKNKSDSRVDRILPLDFIVTTGMF